MLLLSQSHICAFSPLAPLPSSCCLPLSCFLPQALLYAATFTNYDLGAPVNSLLREGGVVNIPFCLSLFNFATLDDFARFVNNENVNASSVGFR